MNLRNTGAMLYQLSYGASLEQVQLLKCTQLQHHTNIKHSTNLNSLGITKERSQCVLYIATNLVAQYDLSHIHIS